MHKNSAAWNVDADWKELENPFRKCKKVEFPKRRLWIYLLFIVKKM